MRTMYEVHTHQYGRRLITRDGPCQGLLEWPQHQWMKITPRPIGLERARRLADEQPHHAAVCAWQQSGVVYDNGKTPTVPTGWWPADATNATERPQPVFNACGLVRCQTCGRKIYRCVCRACVSA